ncbi:hypothetical protein CMK19_00200, partial [Candidatus Poribacteria bacterium]|nr:hypothetical protein [Candidatus Poribacteria bacterium]
MSQLNVDGIRSANGTGDAISLAAASNTCTANITNIPGRNLIINGAMQVAQRGTVTGITGQVYGGPDRFETHINGLGTWTTSQATSTADHNTTGFYHSLKLQNTTADASPAAGDYAIIQQHIEGGNIDQVRWGTANSEKLTLSFWCKANISGWSSGTKAFVAELQESSGSLESGQLVTLNANDTWQKITLTYPVQTGTAPQTGTNAAITVNLWLDAGTDFSSGTLSSSWSNKANADRAAGVTLGLGNNTANYFQLTGVQLEVGDYTTDFEHKKYTTEWKDCCRYYYKPAARSDGNAYLYGCSYHNSWGFIIIDFPNQMR